MEYLSEGYFLTGSTHHIVAHLCPGFMFQGTMRGGVMQAEKICVRAYDMTGWVILMKMSCVYIGEMRVAEISLDLCYGRWRWAAIIK